MPEFKETLERIAAGEANVQALFEGDSRVRDRRRGPKYMAQLAETAQFMADIYEGKRDLYFLKEALTTSDFPMLFADVLDRQLLASYAELPAVWRQFVKRSVVPDFRQVARGALDGLEGRLPRVGEREEYPEGTVAESEDRYRVYKHGRRIDLSWEMLVNDDLDQFRTLPDRLARAARRTEQWAATELYVDEDGPHADLYLAGVNIIPGNPELSFAGLQEGFAAFAAVEDEDGEPIVIESAVLVVPPALEVVANNILNATEVELDTTGGRFRTANWMRNKTTLVVDPYIPRVATDANGSTMWSLFADPNNGRGALELGFLRGNEEPALYERAPNARRVGGGDVMESFEDDSHAWRVRHVLGGARLVSTGGRKATVASNGSGV